MGLILFSITLMHPWMVNCICPPWASLVPWALEMQIIHLACQDGLYQNPPANLYRGMPSYQDNSLRSSVIPVTLLAVAAGAPNQMTHLCFCRWWRWWGLYTHVLSSNSNYHSIDDSSGTSCTPVSPLATSSASDVSRLATFPASDACTIIAGNTASNSTTFPLSASISFSFQFLKVINIHRQEDSTD